MDTTDWPALNTYEPVRCPNCGHDRMAQKYVPGEGGTRTVQERGEDGETWYRLIQGEPVAFTCWECDYEAPTKEPFEKAAKDHAEAERLAAREPVERQAQDYAAMLEGRRIVSANFHVEESSGMGVAIEGVTLTLDDGTRVSLNAFGWHDIQTLGVDFS